MGHFGAKSDENIKVGPCCVSQWVFSLTRMITLRHEYGGCKRYDVTGVPVYVHLSGPPENASPRPRYTVFQKMSHFVGIDLEPH